MKKRGLNLPKERRFVGPASIWKRAIAFIIDLLIIEFIIALPFRGIFTRMIPAGSLKETYSYLQSHPGVSTKMNMVMVVIGLLALLYFAILEIKIQQTIGKMFMNIYVKSMTKRLTFWQCLVRNMFFILIFPFI